MNTYDVEAQAAVEGELLPRNSAGEITEDMVLMTMRMMNNEEKLELLKQATKIINTKNKKMNALLRVARTKIRVP